MEQFGKISFIILTIIISTLIRGFVLMKVWAWFVVTAFALQPITILQAIGLSFVIAVAYGYRPPKKKSEEDAFQDVINTLVGSLIYHAITLLFAWLFYIIFF